MVLSDIDTNINYIESININKHDIDYESYVYKGHIYGKNIKFILGKPNFEYIDNNIVYFNLYLVNDTEEFVNVGIYETENTIYRDLLDDEGNVIIEKLNSPLLYGFAKNLILTKYTIDESEFGLEQDAPDSGEDDADSEDDDLDSDTVISDGDATSDEGVSSDEGALSNESVSSDEDTGVKDIDVNKPLVDKEQTKEDSESEMQAYVKKGDSKWINNYMKSHKYSIMTNEGGGDCFFATLRDALKTLDSDKYKSVSVKSIRAKLADEVDKDLFTEYFTLYNDLYHGYQEEKESLQKYKKTHGTLKKIITATANSSDKQKLLEQAKANLEMIKSASDSTNAQTQLLDEFKFMKDVKTVDDLRAVVKTSVFWADVWAVTTLERLYNVKFMILSKDNFVSGDTHNVLQCGEIDKKLQKKALFEPDFYIIANYHAGIHYELITYDKNLNIGALTFKQLPYRLKELVLNRCMEKDSGPFSLIPDFRNFAAANNVAIDDIKDIRDEQLDSLKSASKSELFDESIIIQIHDRAADKPIAGNKKDISESGEFYATSKIKEFESSHKQLIKIKDWRKKLYNNWMIKGDLPLTIDGHNWPSVQHYLYASRFVGLPDVNRKLMSDSDDDASKSVDDAKKLYEKIMKDKTLKAKIKPDEIFEKELPKILEKALMAKFSIEEFKQILLLTGNAKIVIYKVRQPRQDATELMKVRKIVRS